MKSYTPEMNKLLGAVGSARYEDSINATSQLAKALEEPLRKGIMSGDITGDIFEKIVLAPGTVPEFQLDLLAPGSESEFIAYTMNSHGRIPEKHTEADWLTLPTYDLAASIDWLLRHARDIRWDIVERNMKILKDSFVKKINDDAWHTLLSAAVDRNILVFDSDAPASMFTKRVVSLLKVIMRRNGGGNSTSLNRGKLTDLYMSPENMEDIRNWNIDQIDEITRREIFLAEDGKVNRIFGVNLHDLDEFGVGQEYQLFFTDTLGGSLASSDTELILGLDLTNRDSFVMPIRQELEVFEDPTLHRQGRAGFYARMSMGCAVLDGRRVIAASC